MKIKVMPLLAKVRSQVAKVALEFDDCPNWQLKGFTICENENKELFVLYPSTQTDDKDGRKKTWYFWTPIGNKDEMIDKLEDDIIKAYEDMIGEKQSATK